MSPEHRHTPAEEKKIREAALDETLEGSFPASDPSSTIPNPDDDEAGSGESSRERPARPESGHPRKK